MSSAPAVTLTSGLVCVAAVVDVKDDDFSVGVVDLVPDSVLATCCSGRELAVPLEVMIGTIPV